MLLDTPSCQFGWPAPDFTLMDAWGRSFTMSDHLGENGLVIAFICNHCPYVQRIVDRMVADATILSSEGINVLAIMSNDYSFVEEDSPENMKAFAKKHSFSFPYLIDEDQSVARQYDAVCTPDFFGFNDRSELQYRGRLDDARMGDASGRTKELVAAMRMIASTGRGPKVQHPSMGCSIKWKN